MKVKVTLEMDIEGDDIDTISEQIGKELISWCSHTHSDQAIKYLLCDKSLKAIKHNTWAACIESSTWKVQKSL